MWAEQLGLRGACPYVAVFLRKEENMHAILPVQPPQPSDVIAMVNALCDLADEAENKGLNFAHTSLRWLAVSLVEELEGPKAD